MNRQQDQPGPSLLWQRPWWTRPTMLAAVWLILLAYGSLIPFDLQMQRFTDLPTLLASPRWTTATGPASSLGISAATSDLVANLALYLPLGILLRLAWTQVTSHALAQCLGAVAMAAGMSWCIECLQSLSLSRIPAINDFLANAGAAAVGAAVAVRLRETAWNLAFAFHRRSAGATLPMLEALRRRRHRPGLRTATLVAALLVATWLVIHGATASRSPGLPFVAEFSRPYDVADVLIIQTLAAYGILAGLLAVLLVRRSPTASLMRLLLAVVLFALAINLARGCLRGLPPSSTEPILATMAVGGLMIAAFTAVHAVRRRCRRRRAAPVAVDRRRRRHDYTFAIAP